MGLGEPGVPPYLDEGTVRAHLAERWRFYSYDPWALVVPRPHQSRDGWLREHPGGRYRIETNNLGLVGARPTGAKTVSRRVSIGGDSHTQGAVSPAETFTWLAEQRLRAAGADVELLNAGSAYTSPRAYFGRLLNCLELELDDYVCVIFTGNDFWEELNFATLHATGSGPPRAGSEYRRRLNAAIERKAAPIWQGLNQAYRFKHRPDEAERGLLAMQQSLLAIQDACARRGIRLTVLLLPTKQVVEPEADADDFGALLEILELTPAEARLDRELGERLMKWLVQARIEYVDLAPRLRAARGDVPLYWQSDYHLSIAGNRVLADVLVEVLNASHR